MVQCCWEILQQSSTILKSDDNRLNRLISGEFEHVSDHTYSIICRQKDNGNGTPARMHTKSRSGRETENLFGMAL